MVNNNITRDEFSSTTSSIMKEIKEISNNVTQFGIDLASLPEKMAEKFDERYASKKTEETVDKVMWLVVSAVILAGLALIFK